MLSLSTSPTHFSVDAKKISHEIIHSSSVYVISEAVSAFFSSQVILVV
jgi:hypothetical protein